MRDHALCPVTAVYVSFMMSPGWGDDSPAFVKGSPGKLTPVLYGWFMKKLKCVLLSCGQNSDRFGYPGL